MSSRIDKDVRSDEYKESVHDDRYIRSKNMTTLKNTKKIIDRNQIRIDQYKKDLVDRGGNVENNLIKNK